MRHHEPRDWSKLRGFNYQPSYGMNGIEIWTRFQPDLIASELARGRCYFPNINAIRIWLPWEAYRIDPGKFSANLETFLKLIDANGWQAMPILFNRWRGFPDFGGIYMDHFMPGSLAQVHSAEVLNAYMEAVIGQHREDPRILAWDLCEEPYFTQGALGAPDETPSVVMDAETTWLRSVHLKVKSLKPAQLVTVGAHGRLPLSKVNEFSDVLSVHPYWMNGSLEFPWDEFVKRVNEDVAYARTVGKPLIASECCFGRLDDAERVDIIRGTLKVLKSHGIGWMPHLLHHSLVADAHRPEFGTFSGLYMAFIEADGSLRTGHGVFNEY